MVDVLVRAHRLSARDLTQLNSALATAGRVQGWFRFTIGQAADDLPESAGRVAGRAAVARLESLEHQIVVTGCPLDDNWFSHTTNRASVITTHGWDELYAPPRVDGYLLIEVALSLFIQSCDVDEYALQPHADDTGCLFDMTADKTAMRWKLRCGYICGAHRDLHQRWGGSTAALHAIEQLLIAARAVAIGTGQQRPLAELSPVDVLVVVALREELTPFREITTLRTETRPIPHWTTASEAHSVAFVVQTEMGGIEAAALTMRAGLALRPALLAMSGIMGGLSSDVGLGDVVVAQEVFDYAFGKIVDLTDQDSRAEDGILRDLPHRNVQDQLGRQVQQWIANDMHRGKSRVLEELQRTCAARGSGFLRGFDHRIHFGRVASGPLVVASEHGKEMIRGLKRKVLGVEMEIFGFMHAASVLAVPCVAVKGVSDLANPNKDIASESATARSFAANASAAVLWRLIKEILDRGFSPSTFARDC
jgi:nucleoside phosphorylase